MNHDGTEDRHSRIYELCEMSELHAKSHGISLKNLLPEKLMLLFLLK